MSSLTVVIESYINELFQQEEQDGSADAYDSSVETHGVGYTVKEMVKIKALEIATKGVTVQ